MKKKLISTVMAVCCMLSMTSVQAKGSLAWNESSGKVSVTADKAGTYDVAFTNNKGNTALKEVTFNEAGTQEISVPTSFAASKVFMWNSIEKMKPLTEAMDITDCYGTAVVSAIGPEKVYFEVYSADVDYRWVIEPEADIRIIKNGKEIEYTELVEYDVLTFVYDMEAGFADSEYYNVYVSNDTAEGSVTTVNTMKSTVTVGDNEYSFSVKCGCDMRNMLGTEQLVYMDIFGKIVYSEEIEAPKNYGIVVGMQNHFGIATVHIITADGSKAEYECKSTSDEDEFYYLLTEDSNGYQGQTVSLTDIINGVGIENVVCEYTASDGLIRFRDAFAGKGGTDLEYKQSSNKFGSYQIDSEITQLITIGDYINNHGEPAAVDVSSLVDEAIYEVYLYDKNNDGCYRFAIILSEEPQELPEETPIIDASPIAVIKSEPVQATVSGVECYAYTVCESGNSEKVFYSDNSGFSVGDVIVYTLNEYGYAERNNVTCIMNAQTDYDKLLEDTLSLNDFSEMINSGCIDTETNKVLYGTDDDVELHFGIIYTKSNNYLTLITDKDADGLSNVEDEAFATEFLMDSNANIYVYDYSKQEGRVNIGHIPSMPKSSWNTVLTDDYDKTCIDWTKVVDEGMMPDLALVKTVYGDATDVVVFQAE